MLLIFFQVLRLLLFSFILGFMTAVYAIFKKNILCYIIQIMVPSGVIKTAEQLKVLFFPTEFSAV